MPTIISTKAQEESTYIITCAFTDEDDNAVTPDSIEWTLTDSSGTVINEREQVEILVPAASVDIVLSGDDLQILATEAARTEVNRRFIVEAVYDSDASNDLPLKAEMAFVVENLTYVT